MNLRRHNVTSIRLQTRLTRQERTLTKLVGTAPSVFDRLLDSALMGRGINRNTTLSIRTLFL